MIKKTENFQNPDSFSLFSLFSLFNYFYYLVGIIFFLIMFFFPKIGLIINTILIVYLLYNFYLIRTGPIESRSLAYIFLILPLVMLTILEIILLYIVVFSGKKAETTDND